MPNAAIAVLTEKDLPTILAQKASQAWVLNPKQAVKHRYLVCTRNQTRRNPAASEPHKSAFLVAIIEGVEPLPGGQGPQRYRISFSEYAPVQVLGAWKEWRNPVRYTTLEELGIDPKSLQLQSVNSGPEMTGASGGPTPNRDSEARLTIVQAKEGLARTFGVSPDAIEIIIRA